LIGGFGKKARRQGLVIRMAVFSSSRGSVFEAIAAGCREGLVAAECALFLSHKDCPAADKARRMNIACEIVPVSGDADAWDRAVLATLERYDIQLIALAGFMRRIGPRVLACFQGCIFNSHPSLLPRHGGLGMYGPRVHAAVLAARDTTTGVTVHQVTGEYDAGPVVDQCQVPVLASDSVETLMARVQAVERRFYVEVLSGVARELRPAESRAAAKSRSD
jgi:phosphoribosylglycinamide formyltransferase-1